MKLPYFFSYLLVLVIISCISTTKVFPNPDSLWVDSVQKKLQGYRLENNRLEEINSLTELGKRFLRSGRYQEAINPLEEALLDAIDTGQDSLAAEINYHLAYIYYVRSDYPAALQIYSNILEMDSAKIAPQIFARVLAQVSMVYLNLGEIEKSLNYQSEAVALMEATNDSINYAYNLFLLAATLYDQGSMERSLIYSDSALKISQKVGSDIMIYTNMASLGNTNLELDNYNESMIYARSSLKYADSIKYELGIAYSTELIGRCFVELDQSDSAFIYLEKSLALHRELGYKVGEISGLISLGKLQSVQGQNRDAIRTLDRALATIDSIGLNRTSDDILLILADAHFRARNLEKAYEYQREHSQMKDSIYSGDVRKQMAQLTALYEIRKMEEEKKQAIKQETGRLYTYGVIILIVFLLILAIVMYSRYRIQANANEMLNEKNEELARTNEELEQFAYVASHDLKEPLRMIGSYTGLLKYRYKDLFDDRARGYMGFVEEGVKRMDDLLKDLMIYAGLDEDTQSFKLTDIEEVVQGALRSLNPVIEETNANINVSWLPRITARPTQMAQLFQNLIANALKFRGERTPEITIESKETEDEVVFMVSDNGIGIDEAYQEKIFSIFQRLHQREQYEGTGIGLAICKKVMENHQGKIWVKSTPGKGSTFFVSVPRNL